MSVTKNDTRVVILEKVSLASLLLSIFFLSIDLNLNNIFLVVFIGLQIVLFFVNSKKVKVKKIKDNWKQIILYTLPFWLTLFGLFYTEEVKKGFDFLIRLFPLLFLPIIAIVNPKIFYLNYKKFGYTLVLSCLIVAFWSWTIAIQFTIEQPISRLFGPLHSHHNLIKHIDVHPTYLAIFLNTAIGFLAIELKDKTKMIKLFLFLISLVLMLFMFHLLSRTAMLYLLISGLIFVVYQKKWKVLIGGMALIISLGYTAYNINDNYLRDRLFKSLNLFEKETQFSRKDDRFDRWNASYEIFKERPIIGYGTAGEDKYRRAIFKRNKDMVAYNENYNAHNQFFEYLSTYGIVGALVFILFFGHLFLRVLKLKNYFLLFLLAGLFLGCITESILERSIGVVYTSLLVAFIISSYESKSNTNIV